MSEPISLLDFRDQRSRFELDVESKAVARVDVGDENLAWRGTSGMGTYVSVGVVRRERVFFAFFVLDGDVHLYAQERVFSLSADERIRVWRRGIAPFVKRFGIDCPQLGRLRWSYLFTDLLEDGHVPRDFLLYLTTQIAPQSRRAIARMYWEESAAGRDPSRPSFQRRLSEFSGL